MAVIPENDDSPLLLAQKWTDEHLSAIVERSHAHDFGQPCNAACGTNPHTETLSTIRQIYGSFRRVVQAYWNGSLTVEQERVIEDKYRPEELVAYKPVALNEAAKQPYVNYAQTEWLGRPPVIHYGESGTPNCADSPCWCRS